MRPGGPRKVAEDGSEGTLPQAIKSCHAVLIAYTQFQLHYIDRLVGGTPAEIPEVYKARSPLFHAEKIKKPLLVGNHFHCRNHS